MIKYVIAFLLVASSAVAESAPPVLTADDIRASLGECRNQFSVATKACVERAEDYAANLNHANATVAFLQDTLRQLDAEQDAEDDEAKEPPK